MTKGTFLCKTAGLHGKDLNRHKLKNCPHNMVLTKDKFDTFSMHGIHNQSRQKMGRKGVGGVLFRGVLLIGTQHPVKPHYEDQPLEYEK